MWLLKTSYLIEQPFIDSISVLISLHIVVTLLHNTHTQMYIIRRAQTFVVFLFFFRIEEKKRRKKILSFVICYPVRVSEALLPLLLLLQSPPLVECFTRFVLLCVYSIIHSFYKTPFKLGTLSKALLKKMSLSQRWQVTIALTVVIAVLVPGQLC